MFRAIVLTFAVYLLSGCATDSMLEEVIAHPDYDLGPYQSYTWSDDPVAVIGVLSGAETAQLDVRVKRAVNEILQAKGYRLVEKRNAQLHVTTMIGAIEQTSYSEHVVNSQRYYDAQIRWTQENDYLRGAVSVVITEPNTEDIVWQGSVGDNLKNSARQTSGTIEKFVGMIGEMLPPSR